MADVGVEVLIIFVLMVANGLFAMSEIAILAARKSKLRQRAEEGEAGARIALELAESPGRFLSTVQIGITLVGVLAGTFAGATLAEELANSLGQIPRLVPYRETIGLGIVVLGITYLSLVIGELVPKRLALNNPERIAARIARPMKRLSSLAAPLVRLLSWSTDLVLRLLRVRPSEEPPVSEDEIQIMIEQGTQAGVFEEAEQEMVKGVFRLGERRIDVLMTPRTEIEWLDREAPPEETVRSITGSTHTRFPVATSSLDQMAGVVRARDVLAFCLADEPLDLDAVLEAPLFVPENTPALEVLDLLKASHAAMAFVIDEYGGIEGLVTLTDIMEAILGEMMPAEEAQEARAVQRQDGSWLLDGMLPVDELQDVLGIDPFSEEDEGPYQTLGGMVMAVMQRMPAIADSFERAGLRFEVVDMDGHRVDKVLVSRL
jgi:putative hemolysin